MPRSGKLTLTLKNEKVVNEMTVTSLKIVFNGVFSESYNHIAVLKFS